MSEGERAGYTCPSAPAEAGSVLLGIVGADGKVGYIQPLIEIDEQFPRAARGGRRPEQRFRFAQPCVEAKCGYWTGSECGVINDALGHQAAGALPKAHDLPRCSIRRSCRWFHQVGARACSACPYVVTSLGPDGAMTRVADIPPASAVRLAAPEAEPPGVPR